MAARSESSRSAHGEPVELDVAGRVVRVSSPDKVFFPRHGDTKLDLVRYYLAVGDAVMGAMGGRPVLLQRFPDGVGGNDFFQKRIPRTAPEWLRTTVVSTPNGTTSDALVVDDLAHVVWAVGQGCLGFHVWPYRADAPAATEQVVDNGPIVAPEAVDELRVDLDPQPGVTFDDVRAAAFATRALLDELGMTAMVKTSGSRGLHVYVPLAPRWDAVTVRAAAVALARELARRHPTLCTDAWWKEERGPRVFVDFNQNAPHKTVFGAWSARPRVGAQVSCPITWDDLEAVVPDDLTIRSVPGRVAATGDPWATPREPSDLGPLLELWAADRAAGRPDAPWPPVYPKMPDEPPRVAPSRAARG
ncbi:MAG: non-homologous end-joining DNA ligase [Microthrixaceae bacterium]